VRLDEITRKDLSSSHPTVIRTLRTRESHLGPTIDLSIGIKQGVFLLETEPRFFVFGGIHDFLTAGSVVGVIGGAVVVVTFAENEDVLAASEGVFKNGGGALLERQRVAQPYT